MALSEIELKRLQKQADSYLDRRRPPIHIREQLDLGYRITNQSIELFEIRPAWDNPEEKLETPVAKSTYVKASNTWKVFWMRQDLKWHRYAPMPEVQSLNEFFAVVDEDQYGCFRG